MAKPTQFDHPKSSVSLHQLLVGAARLMSLCIFCLCTTSTVVGQSRGGSIEIWYGGKRVNRGNAVAPFQQPVLPPNSHQQNPHNDSAFPYRSNGAEVGGTGSREPLHNTLKSSFQTSAGPNALPPSETNNLRRPVSLSPLRDSETEVTQLQFAQETKEYEGGDAQGQTEATPVFAAEQDPIDQPIAQQTSFDRTINRQPSRETGDPDKSHQRAVQLEPPRHTFSRLDTQIQQTGSGIFPLFSFALGFLFCLGLVATASFVLLRKVALTNGSLFRIEMVENAAAQLSPHVSDADQVTNDETQQTEEEPSQVDMPLDQPLPLESLGPTFDEKQKLLREQEQKKEAGMIEELYKHNLELRERLADEDA